MTVTTYGPAFVAGATGYTGRALVHELRARGIDTIAHVRPDSKRLAEWTREFGDAGARIDSTSWDEDALTRTLKRTTPTLVFALVGTTRARMRKAAGDDSYQTVDYGLTAMLLRAVQHAAPRARFTYLSAAGVGPSSRAEYIRVRWRLEQELRASGLAWTIVRPMLITGDDREEKRTLERVAAAVMGGALRIAGAVGAKHLQDRYGTLDAAALAHGMAEWALTDEGEGRIVGPAELRSGP
jgi:uncharacterized protein YbjT (DUF2867 family)